MSTFREELINLGTLIAVLRLGPPPLYTFDGEQKAMDGSHGCHNIRCVRADYIVFETRDANRQRDWCRNGAFSLCPHTPKCIWQRDGVFLVCRNTPNMFVCAADCDLGCFGACIFVLFLFVVDVCFLAD